MVYQVRRLIRNLAIGAMLCVIFGIGYEAFVSHRQKLVNLELRGPYRHEQGYSWTLYFPKLTRWADSLELPEYSTLMIYENGRAFGLGHSNHDSIRNIRGGRFSHWGDELYFSSSDNSNPNTNGKQYSIKISAFSS